MSFYLIDTFEIAAGHKLRSVSAQSYLLYVHHLFDLIDGAGFAAWQM